MKHGIMQARLTALGLYITVLENIHIFFYVYVYKYAMTLAKTIGNNSKTP